MAIDDRYDRSGQYQGGDTGPKVEGYSKTVPDRRDHAVATMVGDGYTDNKHGYGAVLDAIENRIAAVDRFNGRGEYGFYGRTKSGETLDSDQTLESMVQARTKGTSGAHQFSNWSKGNKEAYGITQRALAGKPRGQTEQGWYDQAMDVYDGYYDEGQFRGAAQGGTYYQNKAALSRRQASDQLSMQAEYGALPIGEAGHVITGPGLTAFGRQAYGAAAETMQGVEYDDALATGSAWGDPIMGRSTGAPAYSDFAGTEDPMAPGDYGYATPTDVVSGSASDDFAGYDYSDLLGEFDAFLGTEDPMSPNAYGPEFAEAFEDPMQPDAYGAAFDQIDSTYDPMGTGYDYGAAYDQIGDFDPMQEDAYGPATAQGFSDPMAPESYGPATAPGFADPMQPDAYGPATAAGFEDAMQPDAYGPATASWTDDPMAGSQYGPATAGWSADPMAPDAYEGSFNVTGETVAPSKPETRTVTETKQVENPAYAEWSAKQAKGRAPSTAMPSMTMPDMKAPETLGAFGSTAFGIGGFAGMPQQKQQQPKAQPLATPAPPKTISKTVTRQAPVQQQVASVMQPKAAPRAAPQQQSVPFGQVGNTGNPQASSMRADRSVADNAGAYGGKDAFGPNDAFGGMGFRGSKGTDYADVVDTFDKDLGITRSVFDRRGNMIDARTVQPGKRGDVFGIDGIRSDGRGTGEHNGGTLGDGSYAEGSGQNPNDPQGIL